MKNKIIKLLNSFSGQYSSYDVFYDWVKITALAIANVSDFNRGKEWENREKDYLTTISKYTKEEYAKFSEMLALIVLALEEKPGDILGEIYMEAELGNKSTGQFFTPYNISLTNAELIIPKEIDESEIPYRVLEPSCGGGGMIIAVAETLEKRGLNYKRDMDVVAQDLDWKAVYMTYVQLSLLGIKAIVAQGDTLADPYRKGYPKERVFITPAKAGLLLPV